MQKEAFKYNAGGVECFGQLHYNPENKNKRPAVIVAHAWRGQDDFARSQAQKLAELGYIGFAADIFGQGKTATTDEEAGALIQPLFLDRKLLRERIIGAFDAVQKKPFVDKSRIGAIGFCFGGLTVIELFKSGANVRGVVSFHGVLGDTLGGNKAKLEPTASKLEGSILLLHGNEDPMVSKKDIDDFEAEMTKAKADWEIDIYGHAVHAFTNPKAHDRNKGMEYYERASKRAFRSMQNFFKEIFGE